MPRRGVGRFAFAFVLLLYSFLVSCPAPAFADFKLADWLEEFGEKRFFRPAPARLKSGPFVFHPTLRTAWTYDTNILLEPFDRREDVIFNVMPGAIVEANVDTHQLAVGYEADFETFMKHDIQNDQNQNLFALLDLNYPSWYINVLEKFVETSGRAGTPFTDRIPRYDQLINPKAGYRWKRFTWEVGFRHFMRDFRRQINDPINFEVVEWGSVLWVDLFAKLKALAEYSWGQIDYDDNFLRNGTFNTIRVGLEGELRPNLFVKLRVGPHLRNYHEFQKPDFNSWIASALVEYGFRDNIKFEAEFRRDAVEATLVDVNFYKEHLYRLGAEYEFVPRWTYFGDVKYIRHRYSEKSFTDNQDRFDIRRDHHMVLTTGLRYEFREWLEFELAYEYLRRNSNFSQADYTDQRVYLSSYLFY